MEETAISGFRKEKFYTVELELEGFRAASERFASKTDAGRLRTSCVGKPSTVQMVSQKEKTERPPRLYDLTTLQREANRLFDYTAQQTLDYLQALYEKRLATYPRTDSRYLTEDMAAGLPGLCQSVVAALPFAADLPLPVNAAQVIDNSKVTDHHAILPTAEATKTDLSALPSGEKNILFLVAARLLGAVERGELSPEDFMAGISAMLTELIKGYQGVTVASAALSASRRTVIGICPRCGKNVVEGKKSFFCEGWNATPPCGFALWKNDRFFTGKRKELTRKVAAALLKNGRVTMTGLFSEKKGVLYDATVLMEDTGEKFVRFKLEFGPKTPKKKGN